MDYFERGDVTVVRAVLPNPLNDDEFLLLHRHETHRNNPGKLEHPGGKLWTPGDDPDGVVGDTRLPGFVEDQFDGVIREIGQETGFDVRIENNALSRIERYVMTGGKRHGQLYIAYAGVARVISGQLSVDHAEHSDSMWVNRNDTELLERLDLTAQARATIYLYNELILGIENIPDNLDRLWANLRSR